MRDKPFPFGFSISTTPGDNPRAQEQCLTPSELGDMSTERPLTQQKSAPSLALSDRWMLLISGFQNENHKIYMSMQFIEVSLTIDDFDLRYLH